MKVFLLALLSLSACATAKELPHAKDCDGNVVDLHPAGRVTVVMASSQTLADTTREFGRALYGWQGRKEFRVIVVVDLRKSLGTLFKGWTVGKMRTPRTQGLICAGLPISTEKSPSPWDGERTIER
ncbi:MAG: hypothetical protein EBS69_00180 [Verrucomicrobia bacterium]|nr:hypothetical protein [Verrucomicrobiota bacterium]